MYVYFMLVCVYMCSYKCMYKCICMCTVCECMCGFMWVCISVYVCKYIRAWVCLCRCVHATVYTWRSEDNLRYQSSPSALFETSSTHYCVCWAGWSASLTSRGLHLPQPHRCMGITDVGCCICLYMISGIQTQLTAAQHVLPTWAMSFTVCHHMLVHGNDSLHHQSLSWCYHVTITSPALGHHQPQHRFPLLLSLRSGRCENGDSHARTPALCEDWEPPYEGHSQKDQWEWH